MNKKSLRDTYSKSKFFYLVDNLKKKCKKNESKDCIQDHIFWMHNKFVFSSTFYSKKQPKKSINRVYFEKSKKTMNIFRQKFYVVISYVYNYTVHLVYWKCRQHNRVCITLRSSMQVLWLWDILIWINSFV